MELTTKYNPAEVEQRWYEYWLENKFFASQPDDREPYTIVIPPPNVTGMLHMGHMLNNTIQDILIRRARMRGYNACWVPGTDHASIATEAKVVAKLREEGIGKEEIGREKFLEHAWEWKEKHGGIILHQLKKLGASCDWDRTRFTMEEDLSDAVLKVFADLHEKGHIYRGVRMINWDPKAKTALSDEEVIRKEVNSRLYYVKYPIEGMDEFITIATTRPETILGDTAVCVHPDDERYKHLKGKNAVIPFVNRVVPIIFDDYIDLEFGTGALKVTPAHDINDYNLGIKHHLEVVDTLNEDGTMSEAAQFYVGQDRFEVRKQIAKDLDEQGLLVKTEDLINNVGFSERNPDTVIEPRLSKQWFCKMDALVTPALENVMNDNIKIHPPKFKNIYRHWLENIKDWCISRQLWWGHRIPAWYNNKEEYVIAHSREEALEKFSAKGIEVGADELRQDDDVLDTWFSSWLWPISVFNGFKDPNNTDINYYYPTNDLVTGHDIIFFWVARMIFAGYEYKNEMPFKNVYFTGMVRDKQGRKMSKQLGNSPDPIGLIEEFGADGVRVGMMLCSPAGNDLPFDDALCMQGRNFANKIWNAFRLVKGWDVDDNAVQDPAAARAISWFDHKFDEALNRIDDHFEKFRISDALMASYKLVWDEFCSWYLEMVKPAYQQPVDAKTYAATIANFERVLRLLHPFMPFITEEIWQLINDRDKGATIVWAEWPKAKQDDAALLSSFEKTKEIISAVRQIRKDKQVPNKESLTLNFKANRDRHPENDPVLMKLANLQAIEEVDDQPGGSFSFVVDANEYFVPLGGQVDMEAELEKIRKEVSRLQGSLTGVDKKLSNERFMANAPEQVVAMEKKKKADMEAKLKVLQDQLATME